MSEIKWIKIATNIFSDEKVKMIKSLPGGRDMLLIWFQLLALAGRTNSTGIIYFTPQMPYSEEMLAISFDENLTTIKMALQTFKQFGMIDIDDNDFISICNWEKHQNVEGMERVKQLAAERNKKYREKKKLEIAHDVSVTSRDGIDIDKELDKEKEKKKDNAHLHDQFETFWLVYPRKVDKKRAGKSFLAAIKKHSFEQILNGTKAYANQCKRENTEQKFIKHASTYLNNECYLEFSETPKPPEPNKPLNSMSIG